MTRRPLPGDIVMGNVRDVVEWFQERKCVKGDCYRCWQVGAKTRSTCIVEYNTGTSHAWRAESCDACAARDKADEFLTTHIVILHS